MYQAVFSASIVRIAKIEFDWLVVLAGTTPQIIEYYTSPHLKPYGVPFVSIIFIIDTIQHGCETTRDFEVLNELFLLMYNMM